MFRTAALALSAVAIASAADSYPSGNDCTPCKDQAKEATCTIPMQVNFHASETGYFEFPVDCPGEVNPNLLLEMGKTYVFDQRHISNWYHLIGLAYKPDGAHVPVDELEPGNVPPGSGSTCDESNTCPAPMYFRNDTYTGAYNNDPTYPDLLGHEDFGLDAVEPEFFLPLGDWLGLGDMGGYKTSIRFDVETFKEDFFYFCHIHAGMSGRIKLTKGGVKVSEDNIPALTGSPYPYPVVDDFDALCGTFNLTGYEDLSANNRCPDAFLCGDDLSQYAKCVEAMDCHMMASMTTNYADTAYNNMALFCHQMIPHHQNAVNMAKSLLKLNGPDIKCQEVLGPVEEGAVIPWQCELEPLLVDIINVQNSQIIDMRDALVGMIQPEYNNCEVEFDLGDLEAVTGKRRETEERETEERQTEERELEEFESGIPCTPCEDDQDMTAICTIKTTVDMYASELGYYKFDGCAGVNPTLHLKVGKNYIFDQEDKSNWYHLVGFAYEADGAHVPVDELEPGIPPPGTTSDCAETMTCPAPMYWRGGEYQGEYSNVDVLGLTKTTGKDDFGLDAVEPEFFHPIADWESYGTYKTLLHFDNADFAQDFFYFCHVHSGMSGRVKLTDAAGVVVNTEDTPALPYDYNKVSAYDSECGTYALDDFQLTKQQGQCPSSFVCGAGTAVYPSCVDSMNCAMLDGMTSVYGGDDIGTESTNDVILFLRQMIPHHKNAVNMAKGLLKTGLSCGTGPVEEGGEVTPECYLTDISYGIVNTQNKQIQIMESIMDLMPGKPALVKDCDFKMAGTAQGGDSVDVSTTGGAGDDVSTEGDPVDDSSPEVPAEDDGTKVDPVDDVKAAAEKEKESGASKIGVFTGFLVALVTLLV